MSERKLQLPSPSDWRTAAARLGLKRRGGELIGPCPACGGTDRFRVTRRGGFFCRQCCADGRDMKAVRLILERAGLAREEEPPPDRGGRRRRWNRRPDRAGPLSAQYYGWGTGPNPSVRSMPPGSPPARTWGHATADTLAALPVRLYLAGRGAWPPDEPLPEAIRWLPAEAVHRLDIPGLVLPPGAAGAVLYGFGDARSLSAVQWEPLTAEGERAGPRKTVQDSSMRGAAFMVHGAGAVHVAEGPADALAIATWRGVRAWACGGTSGFLALAPALARLQCRIVIEADGDGPGRAAAEQLQDALLHAGSDAALEYWPGCDPAEGLAVDWLESAAQAELDGLSPRFAAEAAWKASRP